MPSSVDRDNDSSNSQFRTIARTLYGVPFVFMRKNVVRVATLMNYSVDDAPVSNSIPGPLSASISARPALIRPQA